MIIMPILWKLKIKVLNEKEKVPKKSFEELINV